MSIACTIESAERKYKRILEDFFTEAWGKTCLYSHGISHHQRVWQFAKELITGDLEEEPWDENFSDRLMIACYLHDSGMSVNPGNGHGIYSSKICREFLRRNGLPEVEYADVLSAIENHDKKEYCDWGSKRELQTILSVADDLDAFGYTGIYRYLEIYLIRGIAEEKAGYMIRENARRRFSNFERVYGTNGDLPARHRQRYVCLDNFFAGYNDQAGDKRWKGGSSSGYLAVAELVSEIIRNGVPPEIFLTESKFNRDDRVINDFYTNFLKENSLT